MLRARKIITAAICGAAILSLAVPFAAAKPKRDKATAEASPSRATQQIVSLTNRERAQRGLPALRIDGRCVSAISTHVADMTRNGFLSHSGSDGSGPDQRYRKLSPRSLGAGENLAYNTSGSGEAFMRQWMGSSDHRSNILNPRYKGLGVAVRSTCSGKGQERRCTYYAGQCFSL